MNYHFSKDYELLWELVQKGEQVICRNEKVPDIATYIPFNMLYGTDDIKKFIEICKKHNLEFLIPGDVDELAGALKEVALCLDKKNGVEVTKIGILLRSGKIQELLKKYEVSND